MKSCLSIVDLPTVSYEYVFTFDKAIPHRDFKNKDFTGWLLFYLFVGILDVLDRKETEQQAFLGNQDTVNHLLPPFIDLLECWWKPFYGFNGLQIDSRRYSTTLCPYRSWMLRVGVPILSIYSRSAIPDLFPHHSYQHSKRSTIH